MQRLPTVRTHPHHKSSPFFPSAELPSDPISLRPPLADSWLKNGHNATELNIFKKHTEWVSNIGLVALGINTGMVQEASTNKKKKTQTASLCVRVWLPTAF